MSTAVGKCGCLCGVCPLNKENLLTMEDRISTSEGCSKYLNWTPKPEKLKQCWGCQSEEGFKYIPNCNMRMCAFHNEIENCAYCSAFPCEDIQRHSREQVEERIGYTVSKEDYRKFVQPWEGAINLTKIRKTIAKEKIVKMRYFPFDLKIVEFPKDLVLPEDELKSYKIVHNLIKTIEPLKNLSYARVQSRKKERDYLVKLLWTMGSKGTMETETSIAALKLSSSDYVKEMKGTIFYSRYDTFLKRAEFFKKKGISIEIIPKTDLDKIMSPSKSLRKEGWSLKMIFNNKLEGSLGIKALTSYSKKLFDKHGKKGFRYFTKADMRILKSK